mmetsp:Transcript_164662/g.528262  ORF Transcript_164662/g.528262 Transcript_164662/m.528262 type:complete len:749 (-) Transcript_164662:450-2696(-)
MDPDLSIGRQPVGLLPRTWSTRSPQAQPVGLTKQDTRMVNDGFLDRSTFEEALRAVNAMDAAGGTQGKQAQVARVDDMVLGWVEQDFNEEQAASDDLNAPTHSDDLLATQGSSTTHLSTEIDVLPVTANSSTTGTAVTSMDSGAALDLEQQLPPVAEQEPTTYESEGKGQATGGCMTCLCKLLKGLALELTSCIGLVPFGFFLSLSKQRPRPVWEMLLPIASALVGARVVVVIAYGLFERVEVSGMQIPSRVLIVIAGLAGWPITTLAWLCLLNVLPFTPDALALRWQYVSAIQDFSSLCIWLATCAVTKAILEVGLQMTLNGLTLNHYETRIQSAVAVYGSLRKLFAIAKAAEKAKAKHSRSSRKTRHAAVQGAAADAVANLEENDIDIGVSGPSRFNRLQGSLNVLAGQFQVGAGFRDASTIEEARIRARRAFYPLVKAQGRYKDQGLSREKVLQWLGAGEKSIEAGIFMMDPLCEEDFVAVVERAYKEQRFITASMSSFDVCNDILWRFFFAGWLVSMVLTLTFMFGVDFREWVMPMITLTVSVCWVLSRMLGDMIQGAIFVLWIRPFDIGDWIKLSTPGHPAKADEMAVRSITLWRTHFVSITGEQHLIQNSVMNGMCITNLNRSSSSPCSPMRIQVPAVTAPAKITELVDSIRQYIADKDTDWVNGSLLVSSMNYSAGYMALDIWPTYRCLHQDLGAMSDSKTRLLLFIHSYMQIAGIAYVRPVQLFNDTENEGGEQHGNLSL